MIEREVTLFEVSPRDGLQNEARAVSTAQKARLIELLAEAGVAKIEAAAFVSPKWVPQMADGADVLGMIDRRPGVTYAALVPNQRGLTAAISAKVDEIAVFISASEGFSQANINCSIEESFARVSPLIAESPVPVRGYISSVAVCPYDGPTDPRRVRDLTERLLAAGCYQVSLGDTIGQATPETTSRLLDALDGVAPERLAGHFHDTAGRAIENVSVCLDWGMRCFDGSAGGLGGCPYAPGAHGNVASEALLNLFEARGLSHTIDREKFAAATAFARSLVE